ncbi:hypothetical protein [Nitrosomonas sp. Nm34]|uniref:hypothetical protein n=1 Tax=Nitrosomonas sp. Nm34 TaxID=1881055 RepID=UPI0008EFC055|nr:hypothetical protein [Nitrosomonas sp. Nm34]SFI96333.1 hypothetical protein SAMN05428978_10685 [Nitrosomonas sp. Nm34]
MNSSDDVVLPSPSELGVISHIAAETVAVSSKVVAAGSSVVLIKDPQQPIQQPDGVIIMTSQPAGFAVAEPAGFSLVDDGDDLSNSDVPVYRALADRYTMPALGFRTTLTRSAQKRWMNGELEEALLLSIMSGLGRIADKMLLYAIIAETPAAFSIGAAAARGLRINDLRALVGTAGSGASFRADGQLVAAGISAELTDCITQTVVGDWSRAAVGLMEDITLVATRANSFEGSMSVTCFANCQALLPVTDSLLPFWTVS